MNKRYLPDFDVRGNIPDGCYYCGIDEFKERFVDSFTNSNSRKSRFEGFLKFIKYISKNINSRKYKIIVDGSYVTTKINPNDIDFLIILNTSELNEEECEFIKKENETQEILNEQRQIHLNLVETGLMDINYVYCCDWYPLYKFKPYEEKYHKYLKKKIFFLDLWGNTRPDENRIQHRKGMILLEIDSKIMNMS